MKLTTDWHIHSRNSCDSASMKISDLVREAAAAGITEFGLTDHINTPFNIPDIRASRAEYDATERPPGFRFGVEASCVSEWELQNLSSCGDTAPVYGIRSGGEPGCRLAIGITADDIRQLGIEYVVAGVHWPMYVEMKRDTVIRDYHRQNMFLATHPLVDIVAHPWWWCGQNGDWPQSDDGQFMPGPWLDDFRRVPRSMHDEFAAAAVENRTAVEINFHAIVLSPILPDKFKQQYIEYLASLGQAGVIFSTGSDCHSSHYDIDIENAGCVLDILGIGGNDIWRPVKPKAGQ